MMNRTTDRQLIRSIEKHTRVLRADMIRFTKQLVRIRTENPPGVNYLECVQLIAERLEEFGLRPRIIKVRSNTGAYPRYCILASYGQGNDILYFHGHYDVVPAPGRHSFKPRMEKDRLYGRGTSDMKGGLAAMIYAVRILQLAGAEIAGQVRLVIVPDEETGGALGYIRRNNALGMLMPEPTGGAIWHACRGAYSLMVTVKGRPAHVVLQHQGVNAFEQMFDLVKALMKLKRSVEKRKTDYRITSGESPNSILMLGGICRCGTNFNVVPAECTLSIERRMNPEESFRKEKERLLNLIEHFRRKGIKISTRVLQEDEACGSPCDHNLARILASSINHTKGRKPKFLMCPGLLEIRYYIRNGIPAYAYGPGLLSCAHGPYEFIPVERIYDCAMVYALTAADVLSEEKVND
jgi:succinyl-diaminopimelate desuccinylase